MPSSNHANYHVRDLVHSAVSVDGVNICYQRFAPHLPVDVVMVHGFSGHGGWWDAVAPLLSDEHGIVSLELSGHGDSGHRSAYSMQTWAAEVAAVIRAVSEPDIRASVIGHSVGGLVSAIAVSEMGEAVSQLVMVDSVIKAPRAAPSGKWTPSKIRRRFATLAEAVARYRLMPEEPVDPVTLTALAERATVLVDGGWQWKLDPNIFTALTAFDPADAFAKIGIPVTVVRGELSPLVDPDVGEHASHLLGRPVKQYDIPGAFHHIPIAQPGPLAAVLSGILDEMAGA